MPLLDEFYGLVERASDRTGGQRVGQKATHRTDRLGHLGHHHDYREPSSTKSGNCELIVDVAELCLGVEDTHVVQLRQ